MGGVQFRNRAHDMVEDAWHAAGELIALRGEITGSLIVHKGCPVEDGEAEKIDDNPHARHPEKIR